LYNTGNKRRVYMPMNLSRSHDPRFWEKWNAKGAVPGKSPRNPSHPRTPRELPENRVVESAPRTVLDDGVQSRRLSEQKPESIVGVRSDPEPVLELSEPSRSTANPPDQKPKRFWNKFGRK
jgi:hypothetical protein